MKGHFTMKYLVLIPDGMADEKVKELGELSPMEKANKPYMDMLAKKALVGTVSNVPEGMVPESDTANMAILSFDPKTYSKGRSPLEALSMGLSMDEDDTAIRCNIITLSEEQTKYEDRILLDNTADEITTEEADELVKAVNDKFANEYRRLYTGMSYKHCFMWKTDKDRYNFARPHDIINQRIGDYLPRVDDGGADFLDVMKASYDILNDHPVNISRRERGLKPGNGLWFWSPGKKPQLPSFKEKWGLNASVISATDLIKGIAICAGMNSIDVEGVTANVHTNYTGKANAAIDAFKNGADYVYIHVEAPDECGHRAEIDNKVLSIELIDEKILKPVYEYFTSCGEDFKIMVLPDHPTPLRIRTHTITPVPFFIYSSINEQEGVEGFDEFSAAKTGVYVKDGYTLMDILVK